MKKEDVEKLTVEKALESLMSYNENEKPKMVMSIFVNDDTGKVDSVNVIIKDDEFIGGSDGEGI